MVSVGAAFDLEGNSVNLEDERHGAHLEAAASFGVSIDREFALTQLPHFIGGPDERVAEDIFDLAAENLRMPRTEFVSEFLRRDTEIFERRYETADVRPRDGYLDFVDWLRGQGVLLALGSLTSRRQATSILYRSGLDAVFGTRVVLREDVQAVKPAPDVYLQTAKLMNVAPCRQIVFDDSPRGITAGIAAGSHPIGMPVILHERCIRALEEARAYRVFPSWRDPQLKEYVAALIPQLADYQSEGNQTPVD